MAGDPVSRGEAGPRAAAVAGDREEVAEHGAARGVAAGPRAGERDVADRLAPDLDAVEDAVRAAEGAVRGHGGREDRGRHRPRRAALGDGEQLQVEAEEARPLHLLRGDAGDPGPALAADRRRGPQDAGRVEPRPEREAGQDDHLVDRVVALDVAARVGLRVAVCLGLGEHLVVGPSELAHRGQDEVGRPVHDAADAGDGVGRQVGGQRREHRDPAADGRLEAKHAAAPAGDRLQLRAVVGDDVLVRGDHRLAGPERRGDEGVGRLVAAHQLHDDRRSRDRRPGGPARRSPGRPGSPGPRPARSPSRRRRRGRGAIRRTGRASRAAPGRRARRSRRRCRRRAPRRGGGLEWTWSRS